MAERRDAQWYTHSHASVDGIIMLLVDVIIIVFWVTVVAIVFIRSKIEIQISVYMKVFLLFFLVKVYMKVQNLKIQHDIFFV